MTTQTKTQTYAEVIASGRAIGASRATDAQAMALFCESSIQILLGAVSPKLIWEGAMKKGLTFRELAALVSNDPRAAEDLMWL